MNLVGYDFEVFKYDWLVVLIEPLTGTETVIHNDSKKLKTFYDNHRSDIWIGYNSRNYDQYILKGILTGFDPKEINDFIIVQKKKGFEFSDTFNRIQLFNYDCMSKYFSLKQLESFMNIDIQESAVPFNVDRPLTETEIAETVKYCRHDVEATLNVFLANKADFEAAADLLTTFDLPLSNIGKTKAQLAALALGCTRKEWFDEWDISIVETLDIKKYQDIISFFKNNRDYERDYITNISGVPHRFGYGGVHGAIGELKVNSNRRRYIESIPVHRKGLLLHIDVTSFYPSIMIRYGFLSRNVQDPEKYKKIYDTRVKLKTEGKKKEQAPYKIILNSTYGICKDPKSIAYDPRQANNVCVNGQLLLLDLIEHLEEHCELIQSNTDGLIIQIPDTDAAFNKIDDICFEWENRTGMKLGFDTITEIFQKDVNNYLVRYADGGIERKGGYIKELTPLDNDLPIVNKALVDYMVNGVPVEETISSAAYLKDFSKTVKLTDKYEFVMYGNTVDKQNKTFRVFASKDPEDSSIYKCRYESGVTYKYDKFANTPERMKIVNGDIQETPVPAWLDKNYYIDLARERLRGFGVV